MRIDIVVDGGFGELAVQAVGLSGADLTTMTRITVDADALRCLLRNLASAEAVVLSVSPVPL